MPTESSPPTPTGPSGAVTTRFGILAVIPDGSGSTFDSAAIDAVASTGAQYMRVNLEWAESEPEPGALSFDTLNDRKIRVIEAAGLRLFPTLYVGSGWMNGDPPDRQEGGSRSYPPDDLSSTWSDETGYSPGYYDFVYRFFSHYRGHFDYVAIENEANSELFWGGTAEEYVRLLHTAYKAVKAADPQVQVVDSGIVSTIWGLCIADDYIRSGEMTRAEGLQLAVDYFKAQALTGKGRIRSTTDAEQALGEDQIQEQCRRVDTMLTQMKGAVDAVNFHFYEDHGMLPVVPEYIRWRSAREGYSPAVVTNELGQRGPDVGFAKGDEAAKAVIKKLITAASLGLEAVVWFSVDSIGTGAPSPDKVGLFGPGGEMRPAASAFRLVVETLAAGYRFRESRDEEPWLFHYVFEDRQGMPSLEAVWSEEGGHEVSLAAPDGASQAIVTDYAGKAQALEVRAGSIRLPLLAGAPVLVQWK